MRIPGRRAPAPVWLQLTVPAAVGIGPALLVAYWAEPLLAVLTGWDLAAASYLILLWRTIWPMDAERTARLAEHEDPNRALLGHLLLSYLFGAIIIAATVNPLAGFSRR